MVAIKALACELPTKRKRRWLGGSALTWPEPPSVQLCRLDLGHHDPALAGSDAIKPWQHRSWIFLTDPNFAVKAPRVLDLYGRRFDDTPLRPGEYVISADEKTSIQARSRNHATMPPATPGRSCRA